MLKKVVTAEVKTDNLLDSKEEAEKLQKKIAEKKKLEQAKKESTDDQKIESKSTN